MPQDLFLLPPGNIIKSFNNEYKVRQYVYTICQYIVQSSKKELWLESERKIDIYGHRQSNDGGRRIF